MSSFYITNILSVSPRFYHQTAWNRRSLQENKTIKESLMSGEGVNKDIEESAKMLKIQLKWHKLSNGKKNH